MKKRPAGRKMLGSRVGPQLRSRSRYLAVYLERRENRIQADADGLPSLAELERDYMNYVLELTNNDPAATAEILAVPAAHLFNRMKKIEVWI
jgi:DNA-binding NtrC family response regulator